MKPDRRRYLLLALALSAHSIWPLLAPGYFLDAHDAPHSLFFLVQFDRAIRDGALIPRWGPDHALGYGYPTFVFYSPLAYYVAEGFHLIGASITAAVKATYALAMVLSVLGMFLLGESLAGSAAAAAVAAVIYAYAPYRFVDMYVRSALAESCALALFPWVLWAFWRLTQRPAARRAAAASLALAALLLTHNVTALLLIPILAAFTLFSLVHHRRLGSMPAWAWCAVAAALAAAIASFSLLPSLLERQYIEQGQWTRATYNLTDHFAYPGQMLSPFWGYGYAVPGAEDGMSFQVGLAPLVVGAGALALAWRDERRRSLAVFFAFATAGYAFLMTPDSESLWHILPMATLAQFPWRLLGIVVLGASVLGAIGLSQTATPGTALLLMLVAVACGLPYARPQHTAPSPRSETPLGVIDFELKHTDMRGMTAWAEHPPADSPKLEAYLTGQPLPLAEASPAGAEVQSLYHGGHRQVVRVRMPESSEVHFHTYYYPGWTAYVDGEATAVWPSGSLGVISLVVPAGEHTVEIRFAETPLRAAAKWITLGAVAVTASLSVLPSRRTRSPSGNAVA